MSEEKDSAFFTDGMQEDILTNLALVKQLRVVSRTSVMQYRNTTKSIRQIAQELGVAYILEGSVRRVGNKVRVTGQLIRAATDEHVWAKAYDRDLTDVFSIQSELSQAIAGALSAALSPQEKSLLERRPTDNLAAYDLYTKGRELRLSSPNGQGESIPLFEQAVSLDPNFAGAWAQLGSAHAQQYFNEADHSDDRLARAKRAIDAAVRLAPNDPEVIEMLGDYYYYGYRDYARASEQYQRLAVLRPNDAAVFGSLGFIHRRQARWGEALAELRRALALEPRNMRYARTLFQLALGLNLYDEALAVQKQVVALHPDSGFDRGQLALVPFLATGSTQEVRELVAKFELGPKTAPENVYGAKLLMRGIGDWEASVKYDRVLRYYDGFEEPHWQQDVVAAVVLWGAGDQAGSRAQAESAIPAGRVEIQQKPSATSLSVLSFAMLLTGRNEEALRLAAASRDLIPEAKDAVTGPQGSLSYAQVLAWTGDKDRALAELARLLRTPFGENIYVARVSPGWWPLHGDPRFEALVHDEKNNAPLFRE
jgi:TolB-like protein